jgi:hypothetical protein
VPLVVGHCYATGKVRGLLCDFCNKALGFARDDPRVLRSLATYLERTAADVQRGDIESEITPVNPVGATASLPPIGG